MGPLRANGTMHWVQIRPPLVKAISETLFFFFILRGDHRASKFPWALRSSFLACSAPRLVSLLFPERSILFPSSSSIAPSFYFPSCSTTGQLMNACVALAKDWRTDKYLRRLEVSQCLSLPTARSSSPWVAAVVDVGVFLARRQQSGFSTSYL